MRTKDKLFLAMCNLIGVKYVKQLVMYVGKRKKSQTYFLASFTAKETWLLLERIKTNMLAHRLGFMAIIGALYFSLLIGNLAFMIFNIIIAIIHSYLILLQKQHIIRIMQIAEAKRMRANKRKTNSKEIGQWDIFFSMIEHTQKSKKKNNSGAMF